jgi:transposase
VGELGLSVLGSCPQQMKGSTSRMQGKEASEQETPKCTAGIDVSKSWLDAHVLPSTESLRVANTPDGIRQLKRWLLKRDVELVAVEATGKWHREVCRSLRASQIAIAVTDPYRVRMFAKAQGIFAKTDRLDAKVLAMFAALMSPSCRVPAPQALEAMQELVTARTSAVTEQTALKNQLSAATRAFLKRQLKTRIKQVAAHIKALEKECLKLIKADEGLARRFAILTSVPSFGDIVAITLIACMAELGSLSDKQIGALGGLAPVADDSGERQGARVVWGGRGAVRRILYLAALSAKSCNNDMRAFYSRLIANGKAPKAALVAVARKLLLLANVLIAEDRIWQPKAPQNA